jgi:murein endopeptidase
MRRLVLLGLLAACGLPSAARAQALGPEYWSVPATPPDCRIGPSLLDAGSVALGRTDRGHLLRGVAFPQETAYAFTWEYRNWSTPSPPWRRYGTQKLVLTVECVLYRYRLRHPDLARVGVADLSLRRGGKFGPGYGGEGHASHQNGLDADVPYPRLDGCECAPLDAQDVDPVLAQELVSAFVRAGARYVFVSPMLYRRGLLHGPRGVVVPLVSHDDHLHVRIRP